MADKINRNDVSALLDDIARDAFMATEEELRALLEDAGLDPDSVVRQAQRVGAEVVATAKRAQVLSLPDDVPKDPAAVRSLLKKLLAIPGAPAEAFTVAFRDAEKQSDHDQRVIAGHLLELIKKNDGAE